MINEKNQKIQESLVGEKKMETKKVRQVEVEKVNEDSRGKFRWFYLFEAYESGRCSKLDRAKKISTIRKQLDDYYLNWDGDRTFIIVACDKGCGIPKNDIKAFMRGWDRKFWDKGFFSRIIEVVKLNHGVRKASEEEVVGTVIMSKKTDKMVKILGVGHVQGAGDKGAYDVEIVSEYEKGKRMQLPFENLNEHFDWVVIKEASQASIDIDDIKEEDKKMETKTELINKIKKVLEDVIGWNDEEEYVRVENSDFRWVDFEVSFRGMIGMDVIKKLLDLINDNMSLDMYAESENKIVFRVFFYPRVYGEGQEITPASQGGN